MADQDLEPFATGTLEVGDGHVLYWEQLGAIEGAPVVYLHGGPVFPAEWRAFRDHTSQSHYAASGWSTPTTRSSWILIRRCETRPRRRGATGSPRR